ncbi:MAG: FHA domain-containing protein [Deltaproteobacteria bacterium]|nr:FHA domain-containing protein [Deltaproteobacteria bacterium]
MDEYVGIVCAKCDGFSPIGAPRCVLCGVELQASPSSPDLPEPEGLSTVVEAVAGASQLTEEELMEQARNYVCVQCSSAVPSGHKFCGACGETVPEAIQELQTKYFGSMQQAGRARLMLIRGAEGTEGMSFLLHSTEHVAGRQDGQMLFPSDLWTSPRHANFIYRQDKLVVRDEGSANGVYVRIQGSVPLDMGGLFLCGAQVFRLDPTPKDTSGPDPDRTGFCSSPKRESPFRITQILEGGVDGMVYCAGGKTAAIGREDSDMNFPEDIYMSGEHGRLVQADDGKFTLEDLSSRNGTYIRIQGERELGQGDYLFIGRQLLRVEITA